MRAIDGTWVLGEIDGKGFDPGVAEATAKVRQTGGCNFKTAELTDFQALAFDVRSRGYPGTGRPGIGWRCGAPAVDKVVVTPNCVLETVENGCGCHIDKQVGRCDGTVEFSGKVKCTNWLSRDGWEWDFDWTVKLPDMEVSCCPDYATYSETHDLRETMNVQ